MTRRDLESTDAQRVRAAFDPEQGGGWQWTSYEQVAPNGDVIGVLAMLCCPLCGVLVAQPDEETIKETPALDWPTNHIEHHVRLGF